MKICANDVTKKGLISKIYKQITQFNIKKNNNNPTEKWAEDLKTFLQRRRTDGERYRKRCSSLLTTRKHKSKLQIVPPHTSQEGHHLKVYK